MKNLEHFRSFDDLQGNFSINYSCTQGVRNAALHTHDAYEIILVLSNDVQLTVNNETYPVPFGSILLFNAMDLHQIHYKGNNDYKRFVIWFKHDFLNDLESFRDKLLKCFFIRGFDKSNLLIPNKKQFDFFLEIFNKLKEASTKNLQTADTLVKLQLAELLIALNELLSSTHSLTLSAERAHFVSVYTAMQYIHEKYSENIDQDKLAKLSGSTKRTLCSNFRVLTGMSTGQYILHCRLNAAKSYLLQGFSVAEVCEKTGFANYSNFSRTFHKHTGFSPKQYALKYRN